MIKYHFFSLALILISLFTSCENKSAESSRRWRDVALRMPTEWYATEEAENLARDVVSCQKAIGGWAKNINYHQLKERELAAVRESKHEIGATIDNGATTTELQFLAKVHHHNPDPAFQNAFDRGFKYLLEGQYENGGWPQFYPPRKGVPYSSNITYNDGAMVHVMEFLQDIYKGKTTLMAFEISDNQKQQARKAFDAGVDCILKTQIIVDGVRTVWCAQHDQKTLKPSKARSYELRSFSGSESVGITMLLMSLENPSDEVKQAVKGAHQWFIDHEIKGIRQEWVKIDGQRDKIIIEDPDARGLWGRFYDLETEQPFFCDRDGIKKPTMAEIGQERRTGYAWYVDSPKRVIDEYPKWAEKWDVD